MTSLATQAIWAFQFHLGFSGHFYMIVVGFLQKFVKYLQLFYLITLFNCRLSCWALNKNFLTCVSFVTICSTPKLMIFLNSNSLYAHHVQQCQLTYLSCPFVFYFQDFSEILYATPRVTITFIWHNITTFHKSLALTPPIYSYSHTIQSSNKPLETTQQTNRSNDDADSGGGVVGGWSTQLFCR